MDSLERALEAEKRKRKEKQESWLHHHLILNILKSTFALMFRRRFNVRFNVSFNCLSYSSEASFYSTPGPRNIGSHDKKIVCVRASTKLDCSAGSFDFRLQVEADHHGATKHTPRSNNTHPHTQQTTRAKTAAHTAHTAGTHRSHSRHTALTQRAAHTQRV